uniref:Large ribosomal subunit protein uL5c n=1 Tax=Polysiphonia sertularioides TaxID=945028 RepID=A0A1Z1M8W5_9FLOR|nr:ribosomal protein L5 [Polysiphonia sertularioides]ARW62537.1 ribosomal protein L5 [Polysiphonia sertularioides]
MNHSLKKDYEEKIFGELLREFQYENIHQVPKLEKITLNRGLGEAAQNNKLIDKSIEELGYITGQKPVITKTKKSIAGFKIREDIPIGIKVTLRKEKMYNFLNKLINLSLPRIRDFRGISATQFDGRGNYNLGLREQIIFPEINYEQIDKVMGINITIVTTAQNDKEGLALLKKFGMPFTE